MKILFIYLAFSHIVGYIAVMKYIYAQTERVKWWYHILVMIFHPIFYAAVFLSMIYDSYMINKIEKQQALFNAHVAATIAEVKTKLDQMPRTVNQPPLEPEPKIDPEAASNQPESTEGPKES